MEQDIGLLSQGRESQMAGTSKGFCCSVCGLRNVTMGEAGNVETSGLLRPRTQGEIN